MASHSYASSIESSSPVVADAQAASRVGKAGSLVSVACMAHCLVMPFILATLPAFGTSIGVGKGIGIALITAATILVFASVCWGLRIHRRLRLLPVFGLAVVFMVAGQLFADCTWENLLVFLGALGLVATHLLNRFFCRRCITCQSAGHAC